MYFNLFQCSASQLFGEADPDQDVSPDTEDPEAAGDAGTKALNNDGAVNRVSTRQWAQEIDYNPEKLFNKFFEDDIKYLLCMSMIIRSLMFHSLYLILICRQPLDIQKEAHTFIMGTCNILRR